MNDVLLPNGCYEESGYDFFEEQVKEEFEDYASRKGYDLFKHPAYTWCYFSERTEDAWRVYHHVRGREFQIKRNE